MQPAQYFLLAIGISGLLGCATLFFSTQGKSTLAQLPKLARILPAAFLISAGFGTGILPISLFTTAIDNSLAIFTAVAFSLASILCGRFVIACKAPYRAPKHLITLRLPVKFILYLLVGMVTLATPAGFILVASDIQTLSSASAYMILFAALLNGFFFCYEVNNAPEHQRPLKSVEQTKKEMAEERAAAAQRETTPSDQDDADKDTAGTPVNQDNDDIEVGNSKTE